MDIRQQLLAAFEAEHREHLDAIRGGLAAAGAGRPADWNDVFRRAHSLKGAARAVGLPPVEALAHSLESLFERIADGRRDLDRDALAAIHLALDRIEASVARMRDGPDEAADENPGDALAALERCLAGAAGDADGTPAVPHEPAPRAEGTPAPATEPAAVPAPAVEAAAEPAEAGPVLRVPGATVAALTRATHALGNALSGQGDIGDGLVALSESALALRRRIAAIGGAGHRSGPRDGAVPASELGDLDAAAAALAREARDLARRQRSDAAAVELAGGRVRDEAERLALVPAASAFGGFARALREMAREQRQEIAVTVRGLDLPVDRATLQALRDPVLHALRNCLSHGAEPVQARLAAGKPEALAILFEVEARGSRLIVGVHDDGRGPDLAAIEARALERGLLAPGQAAAREDLLALVFEPGFSTAAGLDTLSGRGIGLSVVAETARRLGGSVRLAPRAPYGTSLVMNLPLSAARRSLLLVEAAGQIYALPGTAAERLLRPDGVERAGPADRPVARVRTRSGEARALPVADLGALLGTRPRGRTEAPEAVVLLRAGERACLLTVDRLHDVRSLLVLPAPPIGADPGLVVGTVILGSRRPALVLDPEDLIARAEAGRGAGHGGVRHGTAASAVGGEAAGGTAPRTRRSTILVVDDSITTRTLEKSILEAAGYRVVVCVDGQDALDTLRTGIEPVDLVLADVEMPRLDGFGLVGALRAEPAFGRLPVVLMTSRGAPEDVARGLELGADAYLTKQKFDQRELLATVGQLL